MESDVAERERGNVNKSRSTGYSFLALLNTNFYPVLSMGQALEGESEAEAGQCPGHLLGSTEPCLS